MSAPEPQRSQTDLDGDANAAHQCAGLDDPNPVMADAVTEFMSPFARRYGIVPGNRSFEFCEAHLL
ncbi:hypothetical protein [Methylobacterium brachythecii]|uniref:Uncharacterized protein n=1 Tax=Methylobacterium brachythecii TaxID=1176177 RepID=A0A7W6F874_9HYPH|nr:hypothetical protein [Methylobacterium brachythecii]MBB3904158.1 hypothetical protein [Methylobacterium brachythecii]